RKKKTKGIDWLRPDGKTQVSIRYEDGEVTGVEAVVVSTQHDDKVKQKTIEEAIREHVIKPVVSAKLITSRTKIHVNPTGPYAIGVAEPVSMLVDTFGTGSISDEKLTKAVLATFDARPGMLIKELDLRRPIFRKTAAYGHFGRDDADFTWERTPLVEKLKSHAHAGNGHAAANGHGKAAKKTGKSKTAPLARA